MKNRIGDTVLPCILYIDGIFPFYLILSVRKSGCNSMKRILPHFIRSNGKLHCSFSEFSDILF